MTALVSEGEKRHAWLAGLLSLLLPGLGQLYNRDVGLARLLLLATFLVPIPSLWLVAALPPEAAAVALLIALVVVLMLVALAVLQAVLRARRLAAIRPAWFNRWYVYLGLIVLSWIWSNVAPLLPISSIQSYSVPSASMLPTLLVGDYLEANTRAFSDHLPERGDLALFKSPKDQVTDYVKRVIGLPGDRVQMRRGRLYLNDALVERRRIEDFHDPQRGDTPPVPQYVETFPDRASYRIIETEGDLGVVDDTPAFDIPSGYVFVLGDNRDRSIDSRSDLGLIPVVLLRDRPNFIFWSGDIARIGTILE